MSDEREEPLEVVLGRWAKGFRHAADNRYYHLDSATARETAAKFEQAVAELARLRAERDALLEACRAARAFGSQGDTHEGFSVSEMIRAAMALAEEGLAAPGGEG